MKLKRHKDFLKINENTENHYYYVFIDEGQFDYYGEPEGDVEIGYSKLPIYKMDEAIDVNDNAYIASIDINDLEQCGEVLVKFYEGQEREEIEDVIGCNIDKNDITLLYPEI